MGRSGSPAFQGKRQPIAALPWEPDDVWAALSALHPKRAAGRSIRGNHWVVAQFACHSEQTLLVQRGIWARRFVPVRARLASFGKLSHYRQSEKLEAEGVHPLANCATTDERVRFGFHNFRHSPASSLVKLMCDSKTVQGILRHEDVRATMQLYAQSDQESKLEAQGKFLALLLGDKDHLLTETVQ